LIGDPRSPVIIGGRPRLRRKENRRAMHGEDTQRRKRAPETSAPAPGTLGAPSAWVFLVGCTPAEPTPLPQANKSSTGREEGSAANQVRRRQRRVEDWSGRPVHRRVGRKAAAGQKGRPGTRLRRIASGRMPLEVLRPAPRQGRVEPTRIEVGRRHRTHGLSRGERGRDSGSRQSGNVACGRCTRPNQQTGSEATSPARRESAFWRHGLWRPKGVQKVK
jgi:hypothetical protein